MSCLCYVLLIQISIITNFQVSNLFISIAILKCFLLPDTACDQPIVATIGPGAITATASSETVGHRPGDAYVKYDGTTGSGWIPSSAGDNEWIKVIFVFILCRVCVKS